MAKHEYVQELFDHSFRERAGKLIDYADFLDALPKDREWTDAECESLVYLLEATGHFRQVVIPLLKRIAEDKHAKA